MELLEEVDRETFLDVQTAPARSDKRRRVTDIRYGEAHWAVEIRDWVEVPDGDVWTWHPSSGIIIPLDQVTAVREALQRVEAKHGLVGAEAQA